MHAVSTGLILRPETLDLKAVRSLAEMRGLLADAVKTAKKGEWIFGSGIQEYKIPELIDGGWRLVREDLDSVTKGNPVAIMDAEHHTLIVNSKALEAAEFDSNLREPEPEEGFVGRGADGELNGRFTGFGAIGLISQHIPVLTEAELEDCVLRTQRLLNSQGITCHNDMLGAGGNFIMRDTFGERPIYVYEKLRRERKLTARVTINYFAAEGGVHRGDSIIKGVQNAGLPEFREKKWVQVQGVKLFGDTMEIWSDEGVGRSVFPGSTEAGQIAEIEYTVSRLHKMGYQILTYAIGARMVDVIVGAYVKAQEDYPREDPRHIIVLGDGVGERHMSDMKKHGIGVSCQPISFPGLSMLHRGTGGEAAFNWQMYSDRGIVLAAGSGYSSTVRDEMSRRPVSRDETNRRPAGRDEMSWRPASWLEGLRHAMVRDTIRGDVTRGDHGMSLEDGIRMYTTGAAWQDRAEAWRGSLEPGKVADIQVLGEDIFIVKKERIGAIPIVMTIVDGKTVYERTGR